MQDKDPVELAEIERDLEKHKPFDPDEDTEYDVWVQKTYMKRQDGCDRRVQGFRSK